jgi:uncharacterized membrane protein YccC
MTARAEAEKTGKSARRLRGFSRSTWNSGSRMRRPWCYRRQSLCRLQSLLRAAGPPLLFGLRLWVSVCLALYVAFRLELQNGYWAGISAAFVCLPQLGASLRKGWFRMIGTLVGAVAIVMLTACFPQDRGGFLIGLALWGGACAFVSTLLRNFAAYAAALSGYSVAIIAGDLLGTTGGVNGGDAFMLAVTRVSEICIGIVSAGIVLAGTDLGGARRRLAKLFADLGTGITAGLAGTLALAGPALANTRPVRRNFIRQIVDLDPVIDQTIGESAHIRYHTPVLQRAVAGLFTALSAWRAVANHLVRLHPDPARAEATAILQRLLPELLIERADPARWLANPRELHQICEAAIDRLIALPAGTPSQRLLADKAAEALAGMSNALNGLALLVADSAPVQRRPSSLRLRVPDWLPAVVNATRAFATIGAVALFWIITAWPNGAGAITWSAITVILMSPRADQAYAHALRFAAGNALAAVFAAFLDFAVLPQMQTFTGASIAIGAYMVPVGALSAQPWEAALFTPMAGIFLALLGPANQMSYDPEAFYNSAMALVGGSAAAALSFRLLPPPSPAFRTRRLLSLTLRDLRRLARGRVATDWEGDIRGRLSAMPEGATPLQYAQLLAALSLGTEIIQLRHIALCLELGVNLDPACTAIAHGSSAIATAHLARLDAALGARAVTVAATQTILRARASILTMSEVLVQHATYFDAGASS